MGSSKKAPAGLARVLGPYRTCPPLVNAILSQRMENASCRKMAAPSPGQRLAHLAKDDVDEHEARQYARAERQEECVTGPVASFFKSRDGTELVHALDVKLPIEVMA